MPQACSIVGCSIIRGRDTTRLFRIPAIRRSFKNPERLRITTKRRLAWIGAIKRDQQGSRDYEHWRVCSKHFIGGM